MGDHFHVFYVHEKWEALELWNFGVPLLYLLLAADAAIVASDKK